MAPRVKAVVRPPRHGWATDREVVVDSDEEWVDSSAESSGTGSSTSKQRRSDDFDRLQTMQSDKQPVVMAPSPEMTEFVSWGALDEYLKGYSAETYQRFRVLTKNKVETRNKKIQDSGSTKPLVPEEWVHYSKTFVCTHAGRYKPRGQGKRKRQESRALDCGVQNTQVCADPPDSGTADEQLGTGGDEFGSVGNGTYTGGDEMEEDPTSIATEAEQASFQSETPHENDDHGSTLTLANVTDYYQIMSPPKSKGRPKQKPRNVKAKRNQAIVMVQEDLGMHKRQMSLLTVYELLDGELNYKSTHEKLLQFEEFVFANKFPPPIAHDITKLPLTKPLTRPEEVVRIFPKQLINKCTSKVTAYQAQKRNFGDAVGT
ncbi:uncharacterized protein IUM83_13219 [Phytophthora cinnamomi]|uniref:uncharacterized protein n=1 Tax=Phytophthora cinnamomi TaxID=4785 RepID=UPI0035597D57|nr:hypothetical protein IUM83_13219 [Phytophthora cinnamomi]